MSDVSAESVLVWYVLSLYLLLKYIPRAERVEPVSTNGLSSRASGRYGTCKLIRIHRRTLRPFISPLPLLRPSEDVGRGIYFYSHPGRSPYRAVLVVIFKGLQFVYSLETI